MLPDIVKRSLTLDRRLRDFRRRAGLRSLGVMSPNDRKRLSRRDAVRLIGVAGAALTASACNGTPTSPSTTTTSSTTPTTSPTPAPGSTAATCAVSPSETIGPYPSLQDFVRSDIRESQPGLPVTLNMTVVNVSNACAPVSGAVVDVWQCDATGNYSQYGNARNETYLRGLQTTDSTGRVAFTTIYPGWYQGRATHIHVEITVNGRSVKVTQIAFPEDVTTAVYRTGAYAAKGQNTTTNARDNVFSDGVSEQLVSLVGDTTNGYSGTFQVGVSL
jgi:protocatechuate 3,4-dioxygenase beta subunit